MLKYRKLLLYLALYVEAKFAVCSKLRTARKNTLTNICTDERDSNKQYSNAALGTP
jgi:hypothetical protein